MKTAEQWFEEKKRHAYVTANGARVMLTADEIREIQGDAQAELATAIQSGLGYVSQWETLLQRAEAAERKCETVRWFLEEKDALAERVRVLTVVAEAAKRFVKARAAFNVEVLDMVERGQARSIRFHALRDAAVEAENALQEAVLATAAEPETALETQEMSEGITTIANRVAGELGLKLGSDFTPILKALEAERTRAERAELRKRELEDIAHTEADRRQAAERLAAERGAVVERLLDIAREHFDRKLHDLPQSASESLCDRIAAERDDLLTALSEAAAIASPATIPVSRKEQNARTQPTTRLEDAEAPGAS